MTIDSLGSLANLVIAVATVASLIYVATQIRENTSWNRRQALEKIIDRVIEWSARQNENPEILAIYLEGLEGFDSFDAEKKHRYHYSMFGKREVNHALFGANRIVVEMPVAILAGHFRYGTTFTSRLAGAD